MKYCYCFFFILDLISTDDLESECISNLLVFFADMHACMTYTSCITSFLPNLGPVSVKWSEKSLWQVVFNFYEWVLDKIPKANYAPFIGF